MKALFVSGDYPDKNSNASVFTHNQAKALQKQGVDVRVLVVDMRSIRRFRRWGYVKDTHDGVVVYRMAVPCGPIPWLLDIMSPWAGEYAFKHVLGDWGKPDILHTHFSATSLPAVHIKKKHNIPLVLTEHGSGLLQVNLKERDKRLFLETANVSEKIIAVSTSLKSDLTKLTQKSIYVIPNIISQAFFELGGTKESVFTFISVGHLIESKRFDLTINAFSKLHKEQPNTQLLIVGDGVLRQALQMLTQQLGIADSVVFWRCIPNKRLPEMYRKSHCFVLPSMFETFGVVYAEAIACGLPVIATRCGGPEDIVNERNGILISKDREDELFEAMQLMLVQAKDFDTKLMSEDIERRFGEDAVAKQIIDIYNQVIS